MRSQLKRTRDSLDPLLLKIRRAQKHTADLRTVYDDFVKDKRPYAHAFETDRETGDRIYRLSKLIPVPLEFSLLIGDTVSNIRSCLDHAAYLLVQAAGL